MIAKCLSSFGTAFLTCRRLPCRNERVAVVPNALVEHHEALVMPLVVHGRPEARSFLRPAGGCFDFIEQIVVGFLDLEAETFQIGLAVGTTRSAGVQFAGEHPLGAFRNTALFRLLNPHVIPRGATRNGHGVGDFIRVRTRLILSHSNLHLGSFGYDLL